MLAQGMQACCGCVMPCAVAASRTRQLHTAMVSCVGRADCVCERCVTTAVALQVSLPPLRRRRQPLQSQMCMAHLLEAELLGDAQRRTLQSLPHYDRPRHEAAIAHESHKSTVRALHGYAFEATGGARPRLPLSVATGSSLRCMEPWMEPNIARVEGKVPGLDASAKKVGKRLFQSTCQRHRSFGRTLRAGEGV